MCHTILAVDDSETHRHAIARWLEKEGFQTLQAGTGADALLLARSHRPDVILLDVHLPDVSGFEVCRTLKSDPVTGDIPIVIHTASAGGSAAARSIALGACAVLIFPVEPHHLLHVVRGCLARAGFPPQ